MVPYVSVVIPVLNGAEFINCCLESVIKLDYPADKLEIIVVDNGSTDGTVEIIKFLQKNNPCIKLYYEKIKSSYMARNLGVMRANGEIIAFTDIDCSVDKNWLANLVRHFSDDSVGGVAGEILPAGGRSLVERYSEKAGLLSQKRTMNFEFLPYPQTANVAYRKELFDKVGYFDKVISGGDADFAWRVQLQTDYRISYAQDAVVFHKHRTSLKGLFKQQFRYGYGTRLLSEKYKRFYHPELKSTSEGSLLITYLGKTTNYLGQIKLYIILSLSKKADYLLLLEPLLSLVSLCAFKLGRMYVLLGMLGNKRVKNA